jgi:hypothetical protein
MPSGTVRVWIDGVAFESEYSNIASRQREITKIIINNATLKSQIQIDIIPNIQLKEHYVSEETKKGGYSRQLWEKNIDQYTHRIHAWKAHKKPGSRTKKGVCFKCLGIAAYRFTDNSAVHSLAI